MTVIQSGNYAVVIARENGTPVVRFAKLPYPELRAERGDP